MIDALAEYGFHRKPEPPIGDLAAIDEPRNRRMTQVREDLPLAAELLGERGIGPDDLERSLLLEMTVRAIGEIDHRAAAQTEQPIEPPAADTRARPGAAYRRPRCPANDRTAARSVRRRAAATRQGMDRSG